MQMANKNEQLFGINHMKKFYYFIFSVLTVITMMNFSSCLTMVYGPNTEAMFRDLPEDVSDYCDHKIQNYRFPDGKIADVYVFNRVDDLCGWDNFQAMAFDPKMQKDREEKIAEMKERGDWSNNSFWAWKPKGPLTPYYKLAYTLVEQYGEDELLKIRKDQLPLISYYDVNELGELSKYITVNGAAQAYFEDSTGVYCLTIGRPEKLWALKNLTGEQKKHKGQLAYEAIYIPKKMYPKIQPSKLTPAKTKSFDPNTIPDANHNFQPVASKSASPYYYDVNMAYNLQWLAVLIACKGTYDMAYTGDFSAENPIDWYKTSFIKKYLAKNDGAASKGTTLFEGICFDYADFAYQELKNNRSAYKDVANFWVVGTFSDSNDIITYRLAQNGETSSFVINRTPVIVFAHNHIHSHDGAKYHAWFWVQTTDGVVYWVDPTWTDNSGRPVYGIVRGGQEVQLEPDPAFCVR